METIKKDLLLGLDIGTSSLKLVIVNSNTNEILLELYQSTQSARITSSDSLKNEQCVDVIVDLLNFLLTLIPEELILRLKAVQLCGQMHGVLLWNSKNLEHSNLVTWQDARCTTEFLNSLPVKSNIDLNSGYGCATLFWYSLNNGLSEISEKYDSSGTIHDYITFRLSGIVSMSTHNAVSWGYFDSDKNEWQNDLLTCKQFPFQILPTVLKPGSKLGSSIKLLNGKHLENVSIYPALGDLQCSVYSCLQFDYDCVINISTSSQLCISIDKQKFLEIKDTLPPSIAVFSYYEDKILLVAASLNGGNVLDKFVEMLIEWNKQLDLTSSNSYDDDLKNHIWSKLLNISKDWCQKNLDSHKKITCQPLLYGERHAKNTFARITDISHDNLCLDEIFTSICFGLIDNLNNMFPLELLKHIGCKRLIATGSALLRNEVLIMALNKTYKDLSIVYQKTADAAIGAAQFIKKF